MAYGDNILGAVRKWSFNNTLVEDVGSNNATHDGTSFTATPITRDSTHSLFVNNNQELASAALGANFNAIAQDIIAVGGWFRVSAIQGPPCCIFKFGGLTNNLSILLWAGNNVAFQVFATGLFDMQVYTDRILQPNRDYHLLLKFEGNNNGNEFSAYLDGVKLLQADPLDRQPDTAQMPAATGTTVWGEVPQNGSNDLAIGGEQVVLRSVVNGYYSQWWGWEGANALALTEQVIREQIFEPGARPEITISADTEANMQLALDAIASTVRTDRPLSILVEEVTGGGDLNLTADNITFDSRASIHVRYEGTGTLNWTNTNGADASIGSGNVNFINPAQLTINNLQANSTVKVFEAGTETEIAGEDSVTGTFSQTISSSLVDIKVFSLLYRNIALKGIDTSSSISFSVQQRLDPQYRNN